MLGEHRRRQHDVGELGGVGHELLVDADEQIVAQEARRTVAVGRDDDGLVFWISIAVTGGPSPSSLGSPVSTAPMRLMSMIRVDGSRTSALDQRLSQW